MNFFKQTLHIDEKSEALSEQRTYCSETFASKKSVTRVHTHLQKHDKDIGDLKTSVTRLESCGGKL